MSAKRGDKGEGKQSGQRGRAPNPTKKLIGRVVLAIVAVLVIIFAVQGGEFSTLDLIRQRARARQLTASDDSLQHVVDSLTTYEHAVEHDPATQERIAREVFGMVRDKELLYRFTDPADSAGKR